MLPEHVPASDQTVQHRSASRSVSLQRLVAGLLLFSAIGSGKALASYDMKTGGVYAASSLGGNPIFKGGTLQYINDYGFKEFIARAKELEFALCRVAKCEAPPHAREFYEWLDQGRAGEMTWLERSRERRVDPLGKGHARR